MNNSKIVVDTISLVEEEVVDRLPMMRERAVRLNKILEAIRLINGSESWQILHDEVFAKDLETLYKRIRSEEEPPKMYRLQGRIDQAEKLDLDKLSNSYQQELNNLRKQING